jgi:tetratricopeptide (TPR) repeat protein
MKKKMMNLSNVISFFSLILLLMAGCSGETKPPFSSAQEIQQLLDHYPGINQELIYLKVIKYENGSVTIDVIDAEKELAKMLMAKTPLKDMGDDPLAKKLLEIDKNLKQHKGLNEVVFTASCLNVYKKWKAKEKYLEKVSDQEKETFYQELMQQYPDSLTKPYQVLAYLAGERKATALQETYLKKALEVNPNQAEIINALCWLYYTQDRNLPWASEKMEQVLKLFPSFAHGYNTYGAILIRMGDPVKAITYLDRGLKIRAQHDNEMIASDHYLLAISYARSGNMTAAREALDKAKNLNPNDKVREEAEKELRQN